MSYVYLAVAIIAELCATSLLKSTEGFTRLVPTLTCLALYGISFFGLSQAVKTIPVGIAYALWSGLGTVAIVAIGAVFLGEPLSAVKLVGVGLIAVGVVILNLGGISHSEAGIEPEPFEESRYLNTNPLYVAPETAQLEVISPPEVGSVTAIGLDENRE